MSAGTIEIDPELDELDKQIRELQRQKIAKLEASKATVVAQIKAAISAYQLTAADLGLSSGGTTKRASKKSEKSDEEKKAEEALKERIKPSDKIVSYKSIDGKKTWVSSTKGPIPGWIYDAFKAGTEASIIVG